MCKYFLIHLINRDVCCLTLFARGSFWYKCPCILVWKKKSAPQRAVSAVFSCGTCGPQGVLGAVLFLWNLWASRRARCSIIFGTCGPQGVVGAVFLVELVGLKAL